MPPRESNRPVARKRKRRQGLARRPTALLGITCLIVLLGVAELCSGQTSLSVGTAPGYPGSTVSVPVTLRQASNVVAAQFDVAFNPDKVSGADASLGPAL